MGRPPKASTRDDNTHPMSSLSKDPIVREFMNEYWSQQQNSTPLVPIPRDKTKVEYVDAEPLVTDEEKDAYRHREMLRVQQQEEDEEKTKLRSQIKELHALKNVHLQELQEYRKRQEIYESTIRHFLDKEKYTPSSIYTREADRFKPKQDPAAEYVSPVVKETPKRPASPEMIHGLPKHVYYAIRENMFGKNN